MTTDKGSVAKVFRKVSIAIYAVCGRSVCRGCRQKRRPTLPSGVGRLSDSCFLDGHFATIVATFATYGVVNMPCTTVGADGKCGGYSFVVCTAFRGTGLGLFSFRMCHCYFVFCFVFMSVIFLCQISSSSPPDMSSAACS